MAANLPIKPLAMDLLDSLSVHSKMSLLHHIVAHILKMVRINNLTSTLYSKKQTELLIELLNHLLYCYSDFQDCTK